MNYSILEFVKWRGDICLNCVKFIEIDALVLNMVHFLDFHKEMEKQPTYDLSDFIDNHFLDKDFEKINLGLVIPNEVISLAQEVSKSHRYQDLKVVDYVNVIDYHLAEQFSAMTYVLPNKRIYISFRGTDVTLVGWGEDINMIASFPIPAQVDACEYLNKRAEEFPDYKIINGGHSKGANLAVYSSIYCNDVYKERIKMIYAFDGPGFDMDKIDHDRFSLIKDKVLRVVPTCSIVGRMFELDVEPYITKSHERGLNQHDPFSWYIEKNQFLKRSHFTKDSDNIKRQLDRLLKSLNEEEKMHFAEDINRYIYTLEQNHHLEFVHPKRLFSLFTNKHKMKHKNIHLLLKLYLIMSKNNAIKYKLK